MFEKREITFTREKYIDFKKAYKKAKDFGRDRFCFEDQIFLTSYANYVCQYLALEFETEAEKVSRERRG